MTDGSPAVRENTATAGRTAGDLVSGWVAGLRRQAKDVAVRAGAVPYRPLAWSAERWEQSYRHRDTDQYASLNESARYGILAGFFGEVLRPHASVLDVGCGAGLLRARIDHLPFGRYLGVDPTAAAIEQAAGLADERTAFHCVDPLTSDLEHHDVVVCNEVLYVARDPLALTDRVCDLVAPGGYLLCSVWRHPGDILLWKRLDTRLTLLERVALQSEGHPFAPRGWRLACYRRV